jgi:hypothetical protein
VTTQYFEELAWHAGKIGPSGRERAGLSKFQLVHFYRYFKPLLTTSKRSGFVPIAHR